MLLILLSTRSGVQIWRAPLEIRRMSTTHCVRVLHLLARRESGVGSLTLLPNTIYLSNSDHRPDRCVDCTVNAPVCSVSPMRSHAHHHQPVHTHIPISVRIGSHKHLYSTCGPLIYVGNLHSDDTSGADPISRGRCGQMPNDWLALGQRGENSDTATRDSYFPLRASRTYPIPISAESNPSLSHPIAPFTHLSRTCVVLF